MANPIEATPPLTLTEWIELMKSLENTCSKEEKEKRIQWAKQQFKKYKDENNGK